MDKLCDTLCVNLVDKLRMKQALKSINIPRSPVKYAVINPDEQSAIFRVDESINEVENMIISNKNEYSEDRLNSDRDRILRLFDTIHSMVNRQKEEMMTKLEQSFEAKRLKNQELVQYLDDAKRTKLECRQIIVDDTGFEDIQSRNQRVIRLSEECLKNLDHILMNDMTIDVRTNLDMDRMSKIIEDLVTIDIAQKRVSPKRKNSKIKRSNLSNRSRRERVERKEAEHIGNNKENINALNASNLSVNESYHSIYSNRSGQVHDRQDTSSVTESLSNFKFANVKNLGNGEGFGSFTDQHSQWNDGLDISALAVQSATLSPQKMQSRRSIQNSNRSHSSGHSVEEDNCSEITFKPLVDLQEQDVDSGHEDERLLSSFPVKTLYIWGEDVTGSLVWKSRASQTELTFYIRSDNSKARLVCRETKTSKLRLNHYVPPRDIAKMSSNSERSWVWLAYDTTNEDDYQNDQYTTFCAKFPDSKSSVIPYT